MSEAPSEQETNAWHRRMAVMTNNRAWALAEQKTRRPEEDADMLNTAHASLYHWSKVGTAQNVARARMLLGQVQALLGHGPAAMDNAQAAFDFVTGHEPEPWELAFAHAVLANAAAAAGLKDRHRLHYETAQSLGEQLQVPEEREIFSCTLAVVPRPLD